MTSASEGNPVGQGNSSAQGAASRVKTDISSAPVPGFASAPSGESLSRSEPLLAR